MALAKLKELVKSVEDLTGELCTENVKVENILDEFTQRLLAPTESSNTVGNIKKGFDEIKTDLEIVQKQATDKLVVTFVGTVNSGKSSLINALLREDRLPTTCGESTMCLFKISTTEEESWSVQLGGGEKLYGDHVEDIRQLYCKMADSKTRAKREKNKKKIKIDSVVQVNWPQKLCKTLPENVVLYDTPGFGENKEVTKVVEGSCQTADIIVAVMDTMSPQLVAVSKLTTFEVKINSH